MMNKDGPFKTAKPGNQKAGEVVSNTTGGHKVAQGRAKINTMVSGKSQDIRCFLGPQTPGLSSQ